MPELSKKKPELSRESAWTALRRGVHRDLAQEELLPALSTLRDAPVEECLAISGTLCTLGEDLMRHGDLSDWCTFLSMVRSDGPAPLADELGRLQTTPERLKALFAAMEEKVPFPRADFESFVLSLPDECFTTVVRACFAEGDPALPPSLFSWGRIVGRRRPDLLEDLIQDFSEPIATLATNVLPHLGPPGEKWMELALQHSFTPVVENAIKRCATYPPETMARLLEPLLNDRRRGLVALTAKILARPRQRAAIRPLARYAQTEEFRERDTNTKVQVWTALAASTTPEGMKIVNQVLQKQQAAGVGGRIQAMLGRDKIPEWLIQLLGELAQIEEVEVRELLERFHRSSRGPFQQAISDALASAPRG